MAPARRQTPTLAHDHPGHDGGFVMDPDEPNFEAVHHTF